MTIRLLDLLDLSRTPGAVCQSIHSRNAPEVDAGVLLVDGGGWVLRHVPLRGSLIPLSELPVPSVCVPMLVPV